MLNAREWIQKSDGFLSLKHQTHPNHLDPFPDTIHNTCLWIMGEVIAGTMSKEEAKLILLKGVQARRQHPDHMMIRDHGTIEGLNRDQLTFLVPLLRYVGLDKLADSLIKEYGGIMLPHWKDHFYGRKTLLGSLFEIGDVIADIPLRRQTSIVKNMGRLAWHSFQGRRYSVAIWMLRLLKPMRAMEIFGSRSPGTPEKDYPKLPDRPITRESNAPIFIPWYKVEKDHL